MRYGYVGFDLFDRYPRSDGDNATKVTALKNAMAQDRGGPCLVNNFGTGTRGDDDDDALLVIQRRWPIHQSLVE